MNESAEAFLKVVSQVLPLLADGQEVKFRIGMKCDGKYLFFFPDQPSESHVEFSVIVSEEIRKKIRALEDTERNQSSNWHIVVR